MSALVQMQSPPLTAQIATRLETELQSKLVATVLGQAHSAITSERIEQGQARVDVQSVHVDSAAQPDQFSGAKQAIDTSVEIDGELRVPFNVRISIESLTQLLASATLDAGGTLTLPSTEGASPEGDEHGLADQR